MGNINYNKIRTSESISKKEWITPNLSILNINQTKSGTKTGNENLGNVDGNNSNSKLR
jgi:hypothetical protein